MARVLAKDDVRRPQLVEDAERDVVEVADRGRADRERHGYADPSSVSNPTSAAPTIPASCAELREHDADELPRQRKPLDLQRLARRSQDELARVREAAADDHELGVEDVHERADAGSEPVPELGQVGDRAFIAGLGLVDQPAGVSVPAETRPGECVRRATRPRMLRSGRAPCSRPCTVARRSPEPCGQALRLRRRIRGTAVRRGSARLRCPVPSVSSTMLDAPRPAPSFHSAIAAAFPSLSIPTGRPKRLIRPRRSTSLSGTWTEETALPVRWSIWDGIPNPSAATSSPRRVSTTSSSS